MPREKHLDLHILPLRESSVQWYIILDRMRNNDGQTEHNRIRSEIRCQRVVLNALNGLERFELTFYS